MDFCSHDGVDIEIDEYGPARVTHAAPTAAFAPELLASGSPNLTVEGDRITVCGTAVYEVTDWHHRCPGYGTNVEMVLARLVSRSPQHGDLERLLNQQIKAERDRHV